MSAKLDRLPLHGATHDGKKWRLVPGKPSPGDDVVSTWCLDLGWETGFVLDGDSYGGSAEECGAAPAPRVSGVIQVDCANHAVFVFGGARTGVKSVSLRDSDGRVQTARKARLPRNSHMQGFVFILVGDTRRLPARVEAHGAGQRVLARLGRASSVCESYPGAPDGGQPSRDFQTTK